MSAADLRTLARPHVAAQPAYTPGLQPTEPGWIKLNTNENPYPPSPRVVEAIRRETGEDGAALRLYPNPRSALLRQTIAARCGVGEENVLVGNGSDDVLNLLVRTFGGPGAPTGFLDPSYSLYPVLVGLAGGEARPVALERNLQLPVDEIARSGANLFFLTSPHAPTGVGFGRDTIAAVARRFPGVLVVDEAYAAFAAEDAVPLLAEHPRLVVTRTLSKSHALAGLRVGYALAHPEVIDLLDRVRDSYNVGRLAQAAARAALEDRDYYDGVVARIRATRDAFQRDLAENRGWFTYPSQANFVFTAPRHPRDGAGPEAAADLDRHLRERRILVRRFPSHPLTAPFLRITVGTADEMAAVQQALDAWPAPAP